MLVAVAALAVTVQFQATIEVGEASLRVSLSDLVAAAFLPIAAYLFAARARELGAGLGARLITLLLLATLVVGYGLAIGAARLGELQSWPLLKAIGWFALLYYGLLGLLLAERVPHQAPRVFAIAFLATMSVLFAIHIVFFVLATDWIGSFAYRYQGILDNPNAQGFVMLCGFALCLAGRRQLSRRLGAFGAEALAGLALAGVIHSSSLAAVGAALCLILVHWALRSDGLWRTLRVIAIAVALFAASLMGRTVMLDTEVRSAFNDLSEKAGWLVKPDDKKPGVTDASIKVRIETYARAFADWTDAPIFGTGLGTHLATYRMSASKDRPAQQIHNTGLWILSEMGAVGLLVFVALYGSLLWRFKDLMAAVGARDPDAADTLYAAILAMTGWLVMSQAHEFLYQRSLWMVLGLALGVSLRLAASRRDDRGRSGTGG